MYVQIYLFTCVRMYVRVSDSAFDSIAKEYGASSPAEINLIKTEVSTLEYMFLSYSSLSSIVFYCFLVLLSLFSFLSFLSTSFLFPFLHNLRIPLPSILFPLFLHLHFHFIQIKSVSASLKVIESSMTRSITNVPQSIFRFI